MEQVLQMLDRAPESSLSMRSFITPDLQKAFDDIPSPVQVVEQDFGIIRMTADLDQDINSFADGISSFEYRDR